MSEETKSEPETIPEGAYRVRADHVDARGKEVGLTIYTIFDETGKPLEHGSLTVFSRWQEDDLCVVSAAFLADSKHYEVCTTFRTVIATTPEEWDPDEYADILVGRRAQYHWSARHERGDAVSATATTQEAAQEPAQDPT